MVFEANLSMLSGGNALAALTAEFIGTFVVVFVVGCEAESTSVALAIGPSGVALAVLVLAYAMGPVSGGHLNPAVTLAAGLARKLPWQMVFAYILVQLAGGLAAAFSSAAIFGDLGRPRPSVPAVGAIAPFQWWEAMIVEALYTALLAFTVLSTRYSQLNNPPENRNQFYGLAYGFAALAGAYACRPISGGCFFNPAVSLGLDVSSYSDGFPVHGFEYAGYEVLGSVLAALLFKLTRPEEDFFAPAQTLDDTQDLRGDGGGAGATAAAVRDSNALLHLQSYRASLPTKLAAEFLGTFMLTLTLGLSTMANASTSATASARTTGPGWACGALVVCMNYALADVSGGFFNPAVTFAAVLSRKACGRLGSSPVKTGLLYTLIQVLAASLAGLLYAGLYRSVTFPLVPKEPFTVTASYVTEFIFTLSTAFVALSTICVKGVTTDIPGRNYYFGLAYGFSVAVAGLAAERVSGGFVNPATTFGISLADAVCQTAASFYFCATFCLSQLFGALAAALIFYVTHAKEYATPKTPDRCLFAAQAQ